MSPSIALPALRRRISGGGDVTPVQGLAEKITAVYRRVTPEDTDPMLTFDERDMLHWVEQAGFTDIEMDYKAWIKPYARAPNHSSLVSELPQVVALPNQRALAASEPMPLPAMMALAGMRCRFTLPQQGLPP